MVRPANYYDRPQAVMLALLKILEIYVLQTKSVHYNASVADLARLENMLFTRIINCGLTLSGYLVKNKGDVLSNRKRLQS